MTALAGTAAKHRTGTYWADDDPEYVRHQQELGRDTSEMRPGIRQWWEPWQVAERGLQRAFPPRREEARRLIARAHEEWERVRDVRPLPPPSILGQAATR